MTFLPDAVPRLGGGRSQLTESGAPVEAAVSVSAASGRPSWRATLDHGAASTTFAGRLAAGQEAAERSIRALPPAVQPVALDTVGRLIRAAFPDPSAIDPRTRFATWLGVVVDPERPGQLAGLKLYANLTGPGGDGLSGLASRWPCFGPSAQLVAGDGLAEPRFAAVAVGADGSVVHRVYAAPTSGCGHQLLGRLGPACGVDANLVLGTVHTTGLTRALWSGDLVVMVEAGTPRLSVHLSARGWSLAEPDGARVALSRLLGDASAGSLLEMAAEGAPGWGVSGVALGFTGPQRLERVNVYLSLPAKG
jgi:hypothetical protein